MAGIVKKTLRILLWLLLLALIAGGLALLVLVFDLPRSGVIACAAIILALILLFVTARRIYVRRKRRLQIQKIVSIDSESLVDGASERVIDNRWNRAAAIIRQSYLGRRGNPLYALPWYMIMGKTGAGKSSSVRYSGLSAMQTDIGPEEGVQSTSNCDWHFFQEAVIMDTAGRYAVPLNEAEDSREWRRFLNRLAGYRRKEPLNGLVIAIAADNLYGNGAHLLPEAGCLRRRIDEIMRILGEKFPVYLLVTKIDRLPGMARLLEELPEELKKQSLGVFVQSSEEKSLLPVNVQLVSALKNMAGRWKDFCLYSGRAGEEKKPMPHRILAWEEFRAMLPALRAYAEEVFSQNPYQETPLLRGIFFSSALRDQQDESRAFPDLGGLIRRILSSKESTGGVFLHEFFERVLPEDRELHRPIKEYLRWRSSLRTAAYAAMLLLMFGLSALFYLSFQHNAALINRLNYARETLASMDAAAGMPRRLLAFERKFRDEAQLEQRLSDTFIPSMGFSQANLAFEAYSETLLKEFVKAVLGRALANLEEKRSNISASTNDRDFFILFSDIIWRYDLLNAVEEGKSFEEMLQIPAMPQGILMALGLENAPQLDQAVAYSIARSIYSLRDEGIRMQMLRTMRASLAQIPKIKTHSLQWIVYRAGTLSSLAPVTGDMFWSGNQKTALYELTLDPVYTKEGMAVTLDYLDDLNLILGGEDFKPFAGEFMRWYANAYQNAWRSFALEFVEKSLPLADAPVKGELISLLSSDHSPYFALLLRMDEDLQVIRRYLDPIPAWMDDLAVFARSLRLVAGANQEKENSSMLQKLKGDAQDIYRELIDATDIDTREMDMKAQVLTKDLQAYIDSLRGLVSFTAGNDQAFAAVKDAMPNENNSNVQSAPLTLAITASDNFNARLNPDMAGDSPVSALANGPMNFFMQRLMNGAACHIQDMWEGDILARAGALPPSQLQQALFADPGGIVRDFADKTLAYFLNHTLVGYAPEKLDGRPIPFTRDFLAFLNTGLGSYQPTANEYGVNIAALPADVNDGAKEVPYMTELTLHCSRDSQRLVNYNSPAEARFTWQPDICGDTTLSIRFKSINLDVLYAGKNGFLNFLNEFQYGSRTFRAADFPQQQAVLGRLGVDEITLGYRISGADELLESHRFIPGTLPFIITDCKR